MKGKLKKIDNQWYVEWGLLKYPVYQRTLDTTKKQSIVPLKEGAEVNFTIDDFWETGLSRKIQIANLITPPYVSDDFQIGPDGAYEHTDDGLDEFYYHELLDRLSIINDMMENYLMDHPVCEKYPELKDSIERAQDYLGEAYLKMKDITH